MRGDDKRIRLSDECYCLSSAAVAALPKKGHETVPVVVSQGTCTETVRRRMVRVRLYGRATEYLADVVTGGLYRVSDGQCMSSSFRRADMDMKQPRKAA